MLFLKKILIHLYGLANIALFYLLSVKPQYINYVILILGLGLFFVLKFVTQKKMTRNEFINFFVFIFLFVLSGIMFLLLVEYAYLEYIIIIFVPIITVYYLLLIFNFLYAHHKYQPFSLMSAFEYLSILDIYFFSVGLAALHVFLNLPFWVASLLISGVGSILLSLNFWASKFNLKNNFKYIIAFFLILLEVSSLLLWLPISYFVKGLFITIFSFLFIKFIDKKISQKWDFRNVLIYIIICLAIVLVILLTTRWF